jgi:hypothetical protein
MNDQSDVKHPVTTGSRLARYVRLMKPKSALSAVIGNFVLFQILWFAAVLGAAAGMAWPAPVALVALLGWTRISGGSVRADLRLVLIGLATGMVFEILLLASGLIRYELQWWSFWPPIWILCLWAGFAQSFLYSMAWMRNRLWLAAAFGAVGAMLSLYAGLRFGAAEALLGMVPLLVTYGIGWALLVPWLAWLATDAEQHSPQVQA